MSDYFTRVEFQNYGPIVRAGLSLTRLHALIGPNDSGKSCTLRGLRLAANFVGGNSPPGDAELLRKPFLISASRAGFTMVHRSDWDDLDVFQDGKKIESLPASVAMTWGSARTLRLDPDAMRQGTPLLGDRAPLEFFDERGLGLGSVLDAVFARNVRDYLELEDSLKSLFPSVAGFRLFTENDRRQVGVRLVDGKEIRPQHLSEGMLYFLAFSLLPLLRPVSLVLVEEPENGLHPARIAEVMKVLRKVSEKTQVVLATHSPLVINEMRPEEVTLVTRSADKGTTFTPMNETANFEARAKAYALGELWLSYADGKTEAPLFNGAGGTK